MKKEYYEAYEDRYKDAYDNNMLWETKDFSKDVIKVINDYNITKNNSILDQTTPNMIQRINKVFERNPLISKGI